MKYSFKIGSVWGIPIELHITFIFLLAVFFVASYPDLFSFFLIVFLFVFVTVHELSHSVVARHYHIAVRKIVLYPIGGVSEIEEIPSNPSIEWRMAIAGPLSSFVIGAVLFALGQLVVVRVPVVSSMATTGRLMLDLAGINVLLGAFNLIPAFPMDGGRVFRALLAERIGFTDATKYAAFIGRLLGIVMAVVGILTNFWLAIIGLFIYIGAVEESESTIISTTIARVRVRDVMYPEPQAVNPRTTLTEALEVMFRARYHDILVEGDDKSLRGIVTWDEIIKIQPERRNQLTVGELPTKQILINADQSVLEAFKLMGQMKIDVIPVVEKEAPTKAIGVITRDSVAYAYELAKSLR